MINRPHWSYSSVNQYLRCPLQYYFQRIEKLPQPTTGVGLVLGSSVHSALEFYHRRLKDQLPVEATEVRQAFMESWQAREAKGKIVFRKGATREEGIAQGISLVETYLKEPPPEGIVDIERQMLFPLRNSRGEILETPMAAIVDLLTRDELGLKIIELKTSGRSYGNMEVDVSLQPTSYVNAVWESYGEEARVEYAVLVKTKTPKLQRLETARNEKDFGRLGDLVQAVERSIEAKAFYPNESPLNCSFCSYRKPCREWGTRRPCTELTQLETEAVVC